MIPAPQVVDGKLQMNHKITYKLQDIFNLLPDVTNTFQHVPIDYLKVVLF